jgi:lipopolysaccharide O-acetyltransferase
MSGLVHRAKENGWAQVLPRIVVGTIRRLRDSFTARKLCAPGFRAGRSPRLLGLLHMRIGRNLNAGDGLWLESVVEYAGERFNPQLIIGENATLSDSVHIACLRSVTIGSGLLCGSGVIITDHSHGAYRGDTQSDPAIPPAQRFLFSAGEVVIGSNVWLGDGVAVLAGAILGDGVIIGANSVVTGTIPPSTIAVGAPAKPIRRWDADCGAWLPIALDKLSR